MFRMYMTIEKMQSVSFIEISQKRTKYFILSFKFHSIAPESGI